MDIYELKAPTIFEACVDLWIKQNSTIKTCRAGLGTSIAPQGRGAEEKKRFEGVPGARCGGRGAFDTVGTIFQAGDDEFGLCAPSDIDSHERVRTKKTIIATDPDGVACQNCGSSDGTTRDVVAPPDAITRGQERSGC